MRKTVFTVLANVAFVILFLLLADIVQQQVAEWFGSRYVFLPSMLFQLCVNLLFGLYLSYPKLLALFDRRQGRVRFVPEYGVIAGFFLLTCLLPFVLFVFGWTADLLYDVFMFTWQNLVWSALVLGFFLPRAFVRGAEDDILRRKTARRKTVLVVLANIAFVVVFLLLENDVQRQVQAWMNRHFVLFLPSILYYISVNLIFGLYLSYPKLFVLFNKSRGKIHIVWAYALIAGLFLLACLFPMILSTFDWEGNLLYDVFMFTWQNAAWFALALGFFLPHAFVRRQEDVLPRPEPLQN
jgi:preprotein translocase subunit SecE